MEAVKGETGTVVTRKVPIVDKNTVRPRGNFGFTLDREEKGCHGAREFYLRNNIRRRTGMSCIGVGVVSDGPNEVRIE